MKKKLIAIAIAAAFAPAAAMADAGNVNMYGVAHMSLDSVSGNATTVATKRLGVNSNSSRLGVKGSEDLGDGLKAVFQFESGVNLTGGVGVGDGNGAPTTSGVFSTARDMFVGVNGGFGTITVGRQALANQWVYDSNYFADQLGNAAIFTDARQGGRANGMIMYKTNGMSGFNATVSYIPGSSLSSATVEGKNSYGLKLNYAANGITANFGYFNLGTKVMATGVATDSKPLTLAAGYDFGNGKVSAQYVKDKLDAGGTSSTQNIYNIGGKFNVSGNSVVKAQYSKANDRSGAANSGASMFALGYDYNLSKRTTVYASYARTSNNAAGGFDVDSYAHGVANGRIASTKIGETEDPNGFGVGLVHKF
ncbi:MAG: porin [Gallionella sp.]|nr:porin [Gallionella sp.]